MHIASLLDQTVSVFILENYDRDLFPIRNLGESFEKLPNRLKKLMEEYHDELEEYSYLFGFASFKGRLKKMKEMFSEADETVQLRWLTYGSFLPFCLAKAGRQNHVVEWLTEIAEKMGQKNEMLNPHTLYEAFKKLYDQNKLRIAQKLLIGFSNKADLHIRMMRYNNYGIFRSTCRQGNVTMVEKLFDLAEEAGLTQEMFSINRYEVLREVCQGGYLTILRKFFFELNDKQRDAILINRDRLFLDACRGGDRILKEFFSEDEAVNQIQIVLASKNYQPFYEACRGGHLRIVQKFFFQANEQQKAEILSGNHFKAFTIACSGGHLSVVTALLDLAKQLKLTWQMIAADNYNAFYQACGAGHLKIINMLLFLMRPLGLTWKMISANNYIAFFEACAEGHLEVVKVLFAAPSDLQSQRWMLSANDFAAFREVCLETHLEIAIKLLHWGCELGLTAKMLSANDYEVFRLAKKCGDLITEMLFIRNNYYEAFRLPKEIALIKTLLSINHCEAFRVACREQNGEVIRIMISLAKEKEIDMVEEILSANHYEVFREACWRGDLEAANFFSWAKDTKQEREMLSANGYEAFCKACKWGRLKIMDLLFSYALKLSLVEDMLSINDYEPFREAFRRSTPETFFCLLSFAKKSGMLSDADYQIFNKAHWKDSLYIQKLLFSLLKERAYKRTIDLNLEVSRNNVDTLLSQSSSYPLLELGRMKLIKSWKEIKEFAGKIVVFYSENPYFYSDSLHNPLHNEIRGLFFAKVYERSKKWLSRSKELEQGWQLSLLVKSNEVTMHRRRVIVDSELAKDPKFLIRLAEMDELDWIKERIKIGDEFEYHGRCSIIQLIDIESERARKWEAIKQPESQIEELKSNNIQLNTDRTSFWKRLISYCASLCDGRRNIGTNEVSGKENRASRKLKNRISFEYSILDDISSLSSFSSLSSVVLNSSENSRDFSVSKAFNFFKGESLRENKSTRRFVNKFN